MSVVIVDVDCVLADFVLGFRQFAVEWGFPLPLFGVRDPRIDRHDAVYAGLTATQINGLWDVIKQTPAFWRHLPCMTSRHDAVALAALGMGHEIYFATSRSGEGVRQATRAWIERHYGDIGEVVVLDNRSPVTNAGVAGAKAAFAQAIGADYAIDDRPEYVEAMVAVGTMAVRLALPYNAESPMRAVASVAEFCQLVEEGR